jgi:hypothetical protein
MSVTFPTLPLSDQSLGETTFLPLPAGAESTSGTGSTKESGASPAQITSSNRVQDEVKVQIEPPGEIAVYQFVDQNGSLVLQVPPQQIIDLAQEIAQELSRKTVPVENEGGQHGH